MLNAPHEDYWNSGKAMESWSVGYNNYWHSISYGLTWTLSRNGSTGSYSAHQSDVKPDAGAKYQHPAGKTLAADMANYGMNASKHNGTTHSVGLNGAAMPNNALNWNIQQGYGTHDGPIPAI
ncbi:fimbria/pilus outer membrane usher protein [Klebsiella variicola subsp. variicola]|nr:fimbria/pilus outer membrane usher protein [Klebsiella variicola subsp. variicola]